MSCFTWSYTICPLEAEFSISQRLYKIFLKICRHKFVCRLFLYRFNPFKPDGLLSSHQMDESICQNKTEQKFIDIKLRLHTGGIRATHSCQ